MDPAAGTSAKRKHTAPNVKESVKAQKTSAQTTAEPSSSNDPQDNVAGEPDTLFWIVITNVHKNAAYEDIFRALFKGCTHVRSHAFQSNSASQFQGIVEVAIERKEDAEEAINHFQKNIKLFQKTWALCIRRQACNRSSDHAASSSSESVTSHLTSPSESSDEGLAEIQQEVELTQIIQDAADGTGVNTKVTIANIDTRVPKEVIVPLLETAGRLRSNKIFHDSGGKFHGTVEVVYERSEDAIAAVKLFDDNITFFKKNLAFSAR